MTGHTFVFRRKFLLLVCELFRAHEMRSQLELTERFEPSFHRNTLLHRSCGLYEWKWGFESVYWEKGEGILITELHDSHVGCACSDCNGSTICMFMNRKL